eukprot:g5220.t1
MQKVVLLAALLLCATSYAHARGKGKTGDFDDFKIPDARGSLEDIRTLQTLTSYAAQTICEPTEELAKYIKDNLKTLKAKTQKEVMTDLCDECLADTASNTEKKACVKGMTKEAFCQINIRDSGCADTKNEDADAAESAFANYADGKDFGSATKDSDAALAAAVRVAQTGGDEAAQKAAYCRAFTKKATGASFASCVAGQSITTFCAVETNKGKGGCPKDTSECCNDNNDIRCKACQASKPVGAYCANELTKAEADRDDLCPKRSEEIPKFLKDLAAQDASKALQDCTKDTRAECLEEAKKALADTTGDDASAIDEG